MIIKNADMFFRGNFKKLDVRVENGKITGIGSSLTGTDEIDCSGNLLIPGLVDIHTHGCVGYDFSMASIEEMEAIRLFCLKSGVTSILATTMSLPKDKIRQVMLDICAVMESTRMGCKIHGINMEGPYLSMEKRGAHTKEWLRPVSIDEFEELGSATGGAIKIVTLAPELENATEFINRFSDKTILSVGHTAADYEMALQAFRQGVSHCTHLFNGMHDLLHREPGPVGALLDSADVTAEIICDGVHVHSSVVSMLFKLIPDRLCIISDSIAVCGLGDGEYDSGNHKIFVQNGRASLEDGTIAGSAMTAFEGMKNAIRWGVPPEIAIGSATVIPAKVAGIDDMVGSIEVGKRADLLVCSPDFCLQHVIFGGELL